VRDQRSVRFLALALAILPAVLVWRLSHEGWQLPLLDPDLWWQLWAGEEMLAGRFPRTNTLSWTAADTPWVTHEPLVALTYAWAGLGRIGWIRGIVVTAAFATILHLATRRASGWATTFSIVWAIPLIVFGTTERALTWGNLLLAATQVLVLRGSRRALIAAAILVGLWANVHGSFVIGVLWLLLTDWRIGLLACGLTLLNPNGWRIWELLSGYGIGSGTQGAVHELVREWRPLDVMRPDGIVKLACLVVAGALVFWPRPSGRSAMEEWRPRILWLVTTALGIWHVRYCDIAAITLLPFVARELEARLPRTPVISPVAPYVLLMAATAITAPRATVDEARYPRAIVPEIPAGTRVWNDFHLGGFLGYHGQQVFWDSRNDCYPEDVFRDGLTLTRMTPGWREVLDRRQIATVVTAQPQLRTALERDGFEVRATGGQVSVLVRRLTERLRDR
jgi:hypothetical protein